MVETGIHFMMRINFFLKAESTEWLLGIGMNEMKCGGKAKPGDL
jgi:hypothetical protein